MTEASGKLKCFPRL